MRYRHSDTGDLAEVVEVDGVERIRRVGVVEQGRVWEHEQKGGKWKPEEDKRAYTPSQVAAVAFAAYAQLSAINGRHSEGSKRWNELRDSERRDFIATGVDRKLTVERRLYDAIVEVLSRGT